MARKFICSCTFWLSNVLTRVKWNDRSPGQLANRGYWEPTCWNSTLKPRLTTGGYAEPENYPDERGNPQNEITRPKSRPTLRFSLPCAKLKSAARQPLPNMC